MQSPPSSNDPFQAEQVYPASTSVPFAPQQLPNATIPKTFGILNIVFGGIFMLAGIGLACQYLFMPMVGDMMEEQQKQVAARIEAQQKSQVQTLLAEQKAATTDDEKGAIQDQIDQLQNSPPVQTPNMMGMMGLADRRVMFWGVINGLSGAFLNLLMVLSGIGLLLLRRWGRSLALWVAGLKILRLVISSSYYCLVCAPIIGQGFMNTMQQMGSSAGPSQPQAPVEMGTAMVAVYSIQSIGFALFASVYPILCLVFLTRARVKAAFPQKPATTQF